jgi:antitoxin component YwqK of YwqJK toxin-antitoxin module
MINCRLVRTYYESENYENKIDEEYFEINGKKHGLYTRYDLEGCMIRIIEYIDGKKHGQYIEYYHFNNNIFYKCNFNNDIKVGQSVFYHENGQIDNICHYKNGKKSGMRYWYYITQSLEHCNRLYDIYGTLKKSCNYIDGLCQGELIKYNQDGTIKSVLNYVDDKLFSS